MSQESQADLPDGKQPLFPLHHQLSGRTVPTEETGIEGPGAVRGRAAVRGLVAPRGPDRYGLVPVRLLSVQPQELPSGQRQLPDLSADHPAAGRWGPEDQRVMRVTAVQDLPIYVSNIK